MYRKEPVKEGREKSFMSWHNEQLNKIERSKVPLKVHINKKRQQLKGQS